MVLNVASPSVAFDGSLSLNGRETTSGRLREVAASNPERAAVVVDGESTTYAELDRRVDSLAAELLRELGGRDHRVALSCAGSLAMTIGTVAIARAGMVSVPIDPTAPVDRLEAVLGQISSPLLLTDREIECSIPVRSPLAEREPAGAPVEVAQGPLASIVFTSGSTGVPKGIMVPRNHRLDLRARLEYFGDIDEGSRIGALAAGTVGFAESLVHSVIQMGSTLCAYEIRRLGVLPLAAWLEESRVIGFATVPTILRLVEASLPVDKVFSDLRIIVLTGETSTWEDVRAIRRHLPSSAIVYNMFGLTEASSIAMLAVDDALAKACVDESGPLPAGKPASDCAVSIIGDRGELLGVGEVGEIFVEGEGCALGYWGSPELTTKVFSERPDGTRQVRTGDAGLLRADGILEHRGRLDHIVKISGNRIELGDVEAALNRLEGVAASAAKAYVDDGGNTRLTAFVTARPGVTLEPWVLRASLARRLPGAMLPDSIGVLEELPQLANGKVDRNRLPDRAPTLHAGPGGQGGGLELALSPLWCEVLGLEDVGLDDDFFDLGGDSMRAARLFAAMERTLGINRPVAMLLESSTIRRLAAAVGAGSDALGTVLPIQTDGSRPPLFIVHDGIGDVFYASKISAVLGDAQPVYAVQPALLSASSAKERSIEELAARYLGDVRRLQPNGPYLFYGNSLGGLIAFEMARQLEGAGEKATLVILGDSPSPRFALRERAQARLAELRRLPLEEALPRLAGLASSQLRHRAKVLAHRRPRESQAPERRFAEVDDPSAVPPELRGDYVLETYGLMMRDYQPGEPFHGDVHLIRATLEDAPSDRGWGQVVTGKIRISDVACRHVEMGFAPHVSVVAEIIKVTIDNALAEQRAGRTSVT